MKYQIGQNLMLLEFKVDQPQPTDSKPIASATILSYNNATKLYKIKYEEYGTNKTGEMEVPEERLFSILNI